MPSKAVSTSYSCWAIFILWHMTMGLPGTCCWTLRFFLIFGSNRVPVEFVGLWGLQLWRGATYALADHLVACVSPDKKRPNYFPNEAVLHPSCVWAAGRLADSPAADVLRLFNFSPSSGCVCYLILALIWISLMSNDLF